MNEYIYESLKSYFPDTKKVLEVAWDFSIGYEPRPNMASDGLSEKKLKEQTSYALGVVLMEGWEGELSYLDKKTYPSDIAVFTWYQYIAELWLNEEIKEDALIDMIKINRHQGGGYLTPPTQGELDFLKRIQNGSYK